MLFELLVVGAIGALGYNAFKDEESTTRTLGNFSNMIERKAEQLDKEAVRMERKYENGEISSNQYNEFADKYNKFMEGYDKTANVREAMIDRYEEMKRNKK